MPPLGAVFRDVEAALPVPAPSTLDGDRFETLLASALTRAAIGKGDSRLLAALRALDLLEPAEMARMPVADLVEHLRQDGHMPDPRSVALLHRLAQWVVDRFEGDPDRLGELGPDVETLREELRAIPGVGPALAAGILLHGLGRPVYPVDRPTYRVFTRHGWADVMTEPSELAEQVERLADRDPTRVAAFSDGIARVAHDYCRVGKPRCERCPLRPMLPDGGPVEPEG